MPIFEPLTDDTQELSGVFCFYSERRGAEYNSTVLRHQIINDDEITAECVPSLVNYWGTAVADAEGNITPGGVSGNEIVRPDDYKTYKFIGQYITDTDEVFLDKDGDPVTVKIGHVAGFAPLN